MDAVFLAIYVALALVTLWLSRSVTWTVLALISSVSLVGAIVSFGVDHVFLWTRVQLQWALLVALVVPAAWALARRPRPDSPRRYQFLSIGVPVLALTVFFAINTTFWTQVPAYLSPLGFLMGHSMAEDNAKWLDFSSGLATGAPIDQLVPLGGPLQLLLVFVATFMGVISGVLLGGYNEVMVAANTVVYGQFFVVVLAPLALAPLVGRRLTRPLNPGHGSVRIPWPLIWLAGLVLVIVNLMLTAYGHLTLQFAVLLMAFWASTWLIQTKIPYALLLSSLAAAIGMTVWLPLNVVAVVILVSGTAYFVAAGLRDGWGRRSAISLGLIIAVTILIWQPLVSSIEFVLGSTEAQGGSSGGGSVVASNLASPSMALGILAGLGDSTLFAARGGTEQATALLVALAAILIIGAAFVIARQMPRRNVLVALLPLLLLGVFAILLNILDQWATGSAPNYGSMKFTFMVTIVIVAVTIPLALLLLDPGARVMTPIRWVGVGAILFVLVADTLFVRAIAAARPEQWTPAHPFDNPRSYWWPAEVNGTGDQSILSNPVACVYLPAGAKAPSAILESRLSDPQRVYACSRLLAGLSSKDAEAQPIVDWLRREWLTNERAWEGNYGYLRDMPDAVLDKPVILLDDGSNVIGLETMRSLLGRFPATAWG